MISANNLRRLQRYLRHAGLLGTAAKVTQYLAPIVLRHRASSWSLCRPMVDGRTGMEIGGPSRIFSSVGRLPLYVHAERVDNCNFAGRTVWEGTLKDGDRFAYGRGRTLGTQFIRDAVDLHGIEDASYDFVCSSHTLEHVANPLKALREWSRILRRDGTLILVLPHYEATFDHRRPVTSLDHLIDDFSRDVGEDDLSHLPEVLEHHDLARDPEAGDIDAFRDRLQDNVANRCLHHHVFDTDLAVRMVDEASLAIRAVEPFGPHHILIAAQKTGGSPDNAPFLAADAAFRSNSPFATDRTAD